jgi:flagellar basal-body rod protein FlgB
MVMGDITFGSTVTFLQEATKGAATTHEVIANNIANVNTPGFKRTDVSFKEALAATEPRYEDSDELALVTDDASQIPVGPDFDPKPFSISTTVDDTQQMRVDGSNVDIDQEMAKMSINSDYRQTIGRLLQNQYMRIREAIQEKP